MIPPYSQSKQQYMSYTLCQLLWVSLTSLTHVRWHEVKIYPKHVTGTYSRRQMYTLLKSEHVVPECTHVKKRPQVQFHAKVAQKAERLSQLLWVSLTSLPHVRRHEDKNTLNTSLEFIPSWYGYTLLQSEHVVPKSTHVKKGRPQVHLHAKVAQKAVSRYPSTMPQKQPLQITN